jgi:hypothetical protein
MKGTLMTVPGKLRPDGTLELEQALTLPPGPVEVTVRVVSPLREKTWAVLERIWRESEALGLKPRTVDEIDAEINALRDESEEEVRGIGRLAEGAQKSGDPPSC